MRISYLILIVLAGLVIFINSSTAEPCRICHGNNFPVYDTNKCMSCHENHYGDMPVATGKTHQKHLENNSNPQCNSCHSLQTNCKRCHSEHIIGFECNSCHSHAKINSITGNRTNNSEIIVEKPQFNILSDIDYRYIALGFILLSCIIFEYLKDRRK